MDKHEMESTATQITRRKCLAMMAGTAAAALAPLNCPGESGRSVMRLAVSTETLAGANVNDARAAYKVWLHEVRGQLGYDNAEAVPEIFIPSDDLISRIRQGTLDCYGLTALEFAKVVDLTDPETLVIQDYLADGMEYLILVHSGSRFNQIADLRGANVLTHLHRDMVLLPAWLKTMFAAHNLPSPENLFANQKLNNNLNQVLLPVFFRRADAACMARRSWETAVELNPQLGRDVRALAVSPRVIPIVFGFRRGTTAIARKSLIESIQRVTTIPGGREIVALYQSSEVAVRPVSIMKSTLEMVRQFERMSAQQAGARKGPV